MARSAMPWPAPMARHFVRPRQASGSIQPIYSSGASRPKTGGALRGLPRELSRGRPYDLVVTRSSLVAGASLNACFGATVQAQMTALADRDLASRFSSSIAPKRFSCVRPDAVAPDCGRVQGRTFGEDRPGRGGASGARAGGRICGRRTACRRTDALGFDLRPAGRRSRGPDARKPRRRGRLGIRGIRDRDRDRGRGRVIGGGPIGFR